MASEMAGGLFIGNDSVHGDTYFHPQFGNMLKTIAQLENSVKLLHRENLHLKALLRKCERNNFVLTQQPTAAYPQDNYSSPGVDYAPPQLQSTQPVPTIDSQYMSFSPVTIPPQYHNPQSQHFLYESPSHVPSDTGNQVSNLDSLPIHAEYPPMSPTTQTQSQAQPLSAQPQQAQSYQQASLVDPSGQGFYPAGIVSGQIPIHYQQMVGVGGNGSGVGSNVSSGVNGSGTVTGVGNGMNGGGVITGVGGIGNVGGTVYLDMESQTYIERDDRG
eukprot:TRINITY_DN10157_c0_g2_i7.p1 TRINITY_DN10157_c0_g2~~TRINITY_DN10157_c0_g2_i7.p1  ORF type:complete len:273 (-),score=67.96 TRINITY_DN10157_c0_g2_i7:458-1276(-)